MPPPDAASPRCFHCGYDLRGFAVGDRCSECGQSIITLESSPDIPWSLAVASGLTGFAWLSMLAVCIGAWPAILFWLGLSAAGMLCALIGHRTTRRNPHRYTPTARTITLVSIVACIPGTAVCLFIAGLFVHAWVG